MIITNLNFIEERETEKIWELKDVIFNLLNLIVGSNATGKTRMLNVLTRLTEIFLKKMPLVNDAIFKIKLKEGDNIYDYELEILKAQVKKEKLVQNNNVLINRGLDKGEIWSELTQQKSEYYPPRNALTMHVRRDQKEYSYLESILNWADNFHRFNFSGADPHSLVVSPAQNMKIRGLADVPLLLKKSMDDKEIINNIVEDFSNIGYPIETIDTKQMVLPDIIQSPNIVIVKEKDLKCLTEQPNMSQGMYRAFSVITILEYFLKINQSCTICIDDLGEGLDFERSSKLTRLLFNKIAGKNIQLIVTSNDRFLINSIDLKYLNILEREGHMVKAYNYGNSKRYFDEFSITGLNNFDFFADKMYREN